MFDCNPKGTSSVEELTRPFPKLDGRWLKVFTIVPRIIKCMHMNSSSEDVTALINAMITVIDQEHENTSLIEEEKQLAEVVSKLGALFVTVKTVSTDKEESSKHMSSAADALTRALEGASPRGLSEVTPIELSWKHVQSMTTFVEACIYVSIGCKAIGKIIGTRSKKSGQREMNQTLQKVVDSLRSLAKTFLESLASIKDKLKSQDIIDKLVAEVTTSSSIAFCSIKDNETFVHETLLKISKFWITSIQNIIALIENRFLTS